MGKRTILTFVLISGFGIALSLWAGGSGDEDASGTVQLVIPHYKAGQNVGAKFFIPQVNRFNAAYSGIYELVIQEMPQDGYLEKMKQLAQQNRLPALIEGADAFWFEQVIASDERFYNLGPWLNENPEIRDIMIDDSVDFNTRDGKIITLPMAVVRPIGLYYNETLISPKKRVSEMSFEEFTDALGDEKIAFMTGENAWTTGLFFSALIADEPGGAEMLKSGLRERLYDYTGPIWVNAASRLQEFLTSYAAANTLGAAYADAANAFMSANAAVIPNGPWMVNDFTPDSRDKWSGGFSGGRVRGDMYPGGTAIANVSGYHWWIPATVSEREREAALAFLAFIMTPEELEAYMLAEGGTAPKLDTSEDFLIQQAANPILSDLSAGVNAETTITVSIYDVMPQSIGNIEFGKLLPKLIDGSYTPTEFLEELTKKAEETRL